MSSVRPSTNSLGDIDRLREYLANPTKSLVKTLAVSGPTLLATILCIFLLLMVACVEPKSLLMRANSETPISHAARKPRIWDLAKRMGETGILHRSANANH